MPIDVILQDASPLPAIAAQDTAALTIHPPASAVDSVLVESPLPGGVAEVVRFLLNAVPSWLQIGGLVVGAVVVVLLLRLALVRRRNIRDWVARRDRRVKAALVVGLVGLAAGTGAMGKATWDYTQHDNAFCTGCHVMNPAFQRYVTAGAKHDTLSCHSCHQQPISASIRQLYLWVAERPAEIGEHAKVPNPVCEACHATSDTAKWRRIATTAGHRVHLESDSAALAEVQCVTCHGVEVHRFRPVDETCGQSECHAAAATKVVLGRMAGQTMLHCTGCHAFTEDVVLLATRDSAAGVLRPGSPQCLGCHEMQAILSDFVPRLEPHGAKCGTCHDPHQDSLPLAARNSCAASGCHADWRDVPFHVGPSHRRRATECSTCHLGHRARVDASDCQGCHLEVRQRGRYAPPVRFDTTEALRRLAPPAAAHLPVPPPTRTGHGPFE
jgi:hypothetical protein